MKSEMRKIAMGLVLAVMVAGAAAGDAQMRGGMNGGGGMNAGQQNMQQPGMQQPGMQSGTNQMQMNEQMNFIGNMRRNMKAENELSKLALKNSQNDGIKKFAQQIIDENRQSESEMSTVTSASGMNQGIMQEPEIPKETKKAEKDMKKMSGQKFDGNYLAQMNAYLKNDQQVTQQASATNSLGHIQDTVMHLGAQAQQRQQQVAQLAKAENFKMQ